MTSASSPYDDPDFPLPLEIRSDEEAFAASFPDGDPSPQTPLGAAFMWQAILLNPGPSDPEARSALDKLVVNPQDWHGYAQIAEEMQNWGIMSEVIESDERPGELAYVKFFPDTGHTMRAFEDAPLRDIMIATLVRFPDGWWRVFAVGRNRMMKESEIFRS
jgi:hypothetical protein